MGEQPLSRFECLHARMDALRPQGQAFDPVAWHFLETLAGKLRSQQDAVRCLLEEKLERALDAQVKAMGAVHHAQSNESRRIKGRRSPQPGPQSSPLAQLLQHIDGRHTNSIDELAGEPLKQNHAVELNSLRDFRETYVQLRADEQVRQAVWRAPDNAGPLNAHDLLLRSLAMMRELSPAYLRRFISYADALLQLDQLGSSPGTHLEKPVRKSRKKS